MWRWCISVVLLTMAARALDSLPLQIALWPPVQTVCRETDVQGLKLNLPYGDNDFVQGIDLGIVSGSECFTGIQVNVVNWVRDLATGVQIGVANTDGATEGLAIGAMNTAQTRMTGMQVGALNYAEDAAGMQIGLINIAETMVGLQIGLVNVIRDSPIPCIPILNWEF